MFEEIKDPKHPPHNLLPRVKVSNTQVFTAHISIPTFIQKTSRFWRYLVQSIV